jgi:hypothetical protein
LNSIELMVFLFDVARQILNKTHAEPRILLNFFC